MHAFLKSATAPESPRFAIRLSTDIAPPPETTKNAYIAKKSVGNAFTAQNGSKKWNFTATAIFVKSINAANRD